MDSYVDIRLRPDPEIAPHALLSGIYARLHRALVDLRSQQIGVSFPDLQEARPSLGTHLRLHGVEDALYKLMDRPWLNGIHDHVKLSDIGPAPATAVHRHVVRVQAKSSPARLRRRAMRRHGLEAAAAAQRIPDSAAEVLRLPYVVLGSRSTGQAAFPLFIRHGPILPTQVPGPFSSYGLSLGGTVPWF